MNNPITDDLPIITFIGDVISITGKCIPLDAREVWEPFLVQLKNYLPKRKNIELIFDLKIFNSASSLYLTKIFDILNDNRRNMSIVVNWFYDVRDENMEELGEIYQERYDLFEFNLKAKK